MCVCAHVCVCVCVCVLSTFVPSGIFCPEPGFAPGLAGRFSLAIDDDTWVTAPQLLELLLLPCTRMTFLCSLCSVDPTEVVLYKVYLCYWI